MNARNRLEIHCTACGRVALARAEPVYTDFRRTGEAFVCTACGARYASHAETPFVAETQQTKVFRDDERRRCCAWCLHRVVNPFGQRCGLTNREIESTDLCADFERQPDDVPPEAAPRAATAAERLRDKLGLKDGG